MSSNAPWPDAHVQVLRALWLGGLSASQCARKLNEPQIGGHYTRNAVIAKVHRLGLSGRLTPQRKLACAPKPRPPAPPTKALPTPPTQPAPVKLRAPPAKGPTSVRFIDRTRRQCAMFCDGESGPDGFVCGEPVVVNAWCASCAGLCFVPVKPRRAA